MPRRTGRARFLTAGALAATAIGVHVAPGWLTDRLRSVALDASRPGQIAVHSLAEQVTSTAGRWRAPEPTSAANRQITAELEALRLECRRLQAANAVLLEEIETLERIGVSPYPQTPGVPLFVTELISASLVGRETADLWRAGCFIDKGGDEGVVDSALVVAGGPPVIDQGQEAGIVVEQPVYAGRCVAGRIARSGCWLSTVQPVTDAGYRSELVQLVRETPRGRVFGPEGIVEGRGEPLCRVVEVDSTSSVRVGDDVYTANRDARLPYPMYYGRVVKAELEPGARHWHIWIKPAVDMHQLKTVQVLKSHVNPLRTLAE